MPVGVLLLSGTRATCSPAQTITRVSSPTSAAPTSDEALQLLQKVLVQDCCALPLSLKVQSAPAEDIATLVQKKLASSDDKTAKTVRVEVRDVLPARLSFNAKSSTVGGVLRSTAVLTGAKLWVLPHLLLIAPQSALTPAELTLAQIRTHVDFSEYGGGLVLSVETEKVFIAFIKKEITALPTSSVGAPPKEDAQKWQTKVTFDQLSPEAQAMLQQLAGWVNIADQPLSFLQPVAFTPDTIVGTTSTESKGLLASFPDVDLPQGKLAFHSTLGWSDEANISPDFKFGHKSLSKPSAPPIDPSAGKS